MRLSFYMNKIRRGHKRPRLGNQGSPCGFFGRGIMTLARLSRKNIPAHREGIGQFL